MTGDTRIDVVHLVSSVHIGGQEMVILNLARFADRTRFRSRVLCLHELGELESRFRDVGVEVEVLSSPSGGARVALGQLVRRLRHLRPSVLHTHNPAPLRVGAAARILARVPVLVHSKHGRNYVAGEHLPSVLTRLASQVSDMVVAVSNDAADFARLYDSVREHHLRVIHNGIDVAAFESAPRPRGNDPPRGICVARLNTVKDIPTLIEATRRIVNAEPRFTLDLVGDGPERARIEQLVRELHLEHAVNLLGFRDDVRERLGQAHVFLLSSISEGISLTLLEAMAAGIPVVATDVGGNSEVIVSEETGLLVPPSNPVALANATLRILRDPELAARCSIAGKFRVARSFSVRAMVTAYEALYDELLQRRRGNGA